jgi:hypothetical protein
MQLARWVFRLAGIYGLLAVVPMYFLERRIGIDAPPPITHPEYFYGFIGVALAWQLAFLVISLDPVRYRLLMVPAIIEKLSFAAAALVLLLQQRLSGMVFGFAMIDFVLGVLFAVALVQTSEAPRRTTP